MTGGEGDFKMAVGPTEWLKQYQSNIKESKEKLNFEKGAPVDERIKQVSEVMTEIMGLQLTLNDDKVLEEIPKENLLKSVKKLNKSLQNNILTGLKSLRQLESIKENIKKEDPNFTEKIEIIEKAYTLIENNLNEFIINDDFYDLMDVLEKISNFHEVENMSPLGVLTNRLNREFSTEVDLEKMKSMMENINKFKKCLASVNLEKEEGKSYRGKDVMEKTKTERPDFDVIINLMAFVKKVSEKEQPKATYYEVVQARKNLQRFTEIFNKDPDLIQTSRENFEFHAQNLVADFDKLIEEIKNKSS